jgi:7,8-dihydro-6-hydroxymethylpterin-pyrophosphokinase
MADVFLSLGSNIGDRAANLSEAVRRLGAEPGIKVVAVSALRALSALCAICEYWA